MLPSLLPSFRGNTLFPPLCARAAPDAFHPASRFEIAEQAPDHIAANGGTKPLEIRDSELAGDRLNRMFHHFSLGSTRAFYLSEPLLKFFAGQRKNKKQEIDSRPGIVFALVPALGALFQHFVVSLFVFFDDAFEADVAAHFQAAMITYQQKQKPGHTSISVTEWMDAEEIEIQRCREHQRMNPLFAQTALPKLHHVHHCLG